MRARALELPCGVCGETYEVPLSWIRAAHAALRAGCPGTDLQSCPYFAFADLIPERTFTDSTEMHMEIARIVQTLNGKVVTEK